MPNLRRFGIPLIVVLSLVMIGLTSNLSARDSAPVIGLFTDYGWDDPYVAQLKGVIVTIDPNARILDITHSVAPFNVNEGAYLLDQCASEFPAGTIFVAVVDPQVGAERDPIMVQTARENTTSAPTTASSARSSTRRTDQGVEARQAELLPRQRNFPHVPWTRYFRPRRRAPRRRHRARQNGHSAQVAPLLSRQGRLRSPVSLSPRRSSTSTATATSFSTSATTATSPPSSRKATSSRFPSGSDNYSAPLVKTYGDVEKGRLILLYGGNGLLEIGVNQGSAAEELKVQTGATIFLKP